MIENGIGGAVEIEGWGWLEGVVVGISVSRCSAMVVWILKGLSLGTNPEEFEDSSLADCRMDSVLRELL